MGKYSYTGKAQIVTVKAAGTYDITAYGAQGGGTSGGAAAPAGKGAEIGGDFRLQANEKLEIVAGGAGAYGRYAGSGGGGSFVLADVNAAGTLTQGTYTLLLAAGGGGGAYSGATNGPGGAGSLTAGNGAGGTAGSGGGGGSGYKSDGGAGTSAGGGSNRTGNYAGGAAGRDGLKGGFGGGGGTAYSGGGGGGYTGGAGGANSKGGGGGGSIDKGTAIAAQTVAGENAGAGFVTITPNVVCYCSGTLIRTSRGDIAVERLAVGDLTITASGAHRPIRWIGHRTIERPAFEQHPVRILAGAFGRGLPERDLCLSPGHPVLVGYDENGGGGHLVPIMCLINGTTIERVPVDEVTYWHVELDEHDILLAEGLPAESFLDYGNRPWFAEGAQECAADHALHNPDFIPPGLDARCRPVVIEGPLVEAERRRLDALFAMKLTAQCSWPGAGDVFTLSRLA